MANIFKPTFTKTDPQTGEKVKKKAKKWYGRYRDAEGTEQRIPLSENKTVAQQMLAEIVKRVIHAKGGILHPAEAEMKRPIAAQLADFEASLKSRNNTKRYIVEYVFKISRCIRDCRWKNAAQIKATDVEKFLYDLREVHGCSIQTSNHYLRAIKGFCRWLYVNKRHIEHPLLTITSLNARIDRRHDRRALTPDEFARMLDAAECGPPVQGLTGTDRAMLYMVAGWTGFRKGELGSLTPNSFQFDGPNPCVVIEAAYSKHRRQDVQYLHSDLTARLKKWLTVKNPEPDEILFPISQASGAVERRTTKMIQFDLEAARTFWIAESKTEEEEQRRNESLFLCYCDANGRYADFHALRHTFITNLGRAGVSPKTAQSLARHSDIKLTLDIYTHIDQDEQIAAINSLPSPEPKTEEEKPTEEKRDCGPK